MPVVDADTHVVESEVAWSYLSQSEADVRPIPVEVGRVAVAVSSGGPRGKTSAASDAQTAQGTFWYIDGRLAFRGGAPADYPFPTRDLSDIPGRLAAMDQFRVDLQVLYPSVMLSNTFRRPRVELALCRSYNRWMADVYEVSRGRLRWILVPPLQSMNEAVDEIDYGAKHGACGLLLRGHELDKNLDHPYFDPIYRKASECNVPICIHTGDGSPTLNNLLAPTVLSGAVLPAVSAFHTILTSGLPKRYPDLRWGFVETGSSWLPFVLDRTWQLTHRGDERFARPARELLEENRMYVACESHEDLGYIIQWTTENSLVFGTDYGHNDTSTMLDGHNRMHTRTDISAEAVRKIMGDNACALYGL